MWYKCNYLPLPQNRDTCVINEASVVAVFVYCKKNDNTLHFNQNVYFLPLYSTILLIYHSYESLEIFGHTFVLCLVGPHTDWEVRWEHNKEFHRLIHKRWRRQLH